MELTGTWRAALADEELRRSWHDDAFDDSAWEAVEVPGHWRSSPAFADSDGPLLYRRSFEAPGPAEGRRRCRTCDGPALRGALWLEGADPAETEGCLLPRTYEVTGPRRARGENNPAIEVTCSPHHDKRARRNLTGVF